MTESTKCNRWSKQVIDNKHNAICNDNCNTWIHLKCSGPTKSDFKMLGDNPSDNFPFAGMDNRRFENFIFSNSFMKEKCEEKLKTVIKDGNFSNICSVFASIEDQTNRNPLQTMSLLNPQEMCEIES